MSREYLVLDNSLLSAFAAAEWFDSIEFWATDYGIVTTDRVWSREFEPHHGVARPGWLETEAVDITNLDSRPVELGGADWSLIRLADSVDDAILVSNDGRLGDEADARGIEHIWGAKFLIQTFQACGIDSHSYEVGLPVFIDDVPMPESVIDELHNAEKE